MLYTGKYSCRMYEDGRMRFPLDVWELLDGGAWYWRAREKELELLPAETILEEAKKRELYLKPEEYKRDYYPGFLKVRIDLQKRTVVRKEILREAGINPPCCLRINGCGDRFTLSPLIVIATS